MKVYAITSKCFDNLWKIITAFWKWLNKHNITSGFFVTMLGVLAAFELAGIGEQRALDQATKQRLHLTVLELEYNGTIVKEILDNYAKENVCNVNRPDSTAAITAFQDSNILSFLPHHKGSLLKSYISAITTLNQAMVIHQGSLESSGYKLTSTVKNIRQNVRSNAAAVFAMSFVLQEELKDCVDSKLYDREKMKKIEERVKYVKAKALKGEVSLSKEE